MLIDAPHRKLWTPRSRPSPRFRRRADLLRNMAIGDFRLDASGNFLLDSLGNVYVEESCPDIRPTSLLVTLTGFSFVGGCINEPSVSPSYSLKWDATSNPLNVTFTTDAFGGCYCYWARAFNPFTSSDPMYNVLLDIYQYGINCVTPPPFSNLPGFSLCVTRVGTTWTAALITNGLFGFASGEIALCYGTASETNCLTPFAISGGAGTGFFSPSSCPFVLNGVSNNPLTTGGLMSITPQTC